MVYGQCYNTLITLEKNYHIMILNLPRNQSSSVMTRSSLQGYYDGIMWHPEQI